MLELSKRIAAFEAAEEAHVEARAEADRAQDYYDGNQLTREELAALQKRKQPPVVENLVRPKIDSLCGLERQSRTDPHCYPRTIGDEESAQIATDALRYVHDDQRLDVKFSAVFRDMMIPGFGGVEVLAKRLRNGFIDPEVLWISSDRMFYDPHSAQLDFSDSNYHGFITWMDANKAKKRWKGKEAVIDASVSKSTSTASDAYEDKPKWTYWVDKGRNRVRIVTMYHLDDDGIWYRSVFTLAGDLEECQPCIYLDEDGKPDCPLIIQSAYIDRDNDRYGLVRDLFSLQDEVNKRRSKFLHLANSNRVRASRAFEGSKEAIRKEMARPDGVIIADDGELEELGNANMAAGHFQLLAEAKQAIQGTGPNAHMQGKEGEGQSGRAILAMQQAGMTEMAPLLDGLRDFKLRVFRAIWNRIRQFWTEERWIRVTEDERSIKFFAVNTTKGTLAMQKLKEMVEGQQIAPEEAQQYAQQIQMHPASQQPANVLSELDVDIQIDEVMNTPTLHAEQFQELAKLAGTGMVQIPPELLIQASNLRDKQKLLDMLEEQKEAQGQQAQQQAEIAQRGIIAEVAGKEAKAALDATKAEGEQIKNALMVPQAQMQAFQAGQQGVQQ